MSLKQYLVAQDKINFMNNFGTDEQKTTTISKKRGRPKQTNSDGEEVGDGFSDDEQ